MLLSVAEVREELATGKPLWLAGSEWALSQLPRGNWIGGTIPYFMDANGCVCSETNIFVTEPSVAQHVEIREYTKGSLPHICKDAPENGYSFLIIPGGSEVHRDYARDAPGYQDLFLKPVVGWIAGLHLSQLGKQKPKVFNGRSGNSSTDTAMVMHVTLPADLVAEVEILNLFTPGSGETITFPVSGFTASECLVNGKPANLVSYFKTARIDQTVPLVADYNGSILNVSVQEVDEAAGIVKFYAPVFAGVEYKLAAPMADYISAFRAAVGSDGRSEFNCNCILNYLYADLEGKQLGHSYGPVTFGEIAHQLMNQTLVRLVLRKVNVNQLMNLDGALCAAVIDYNTGMTLASIGSGVDLEIAARGQKDLVRANMDTIRFLNLNDEIEDILISLGRQYHLMRPMRNHSGLFLYYVLDRNRANLAMARRMLLDAEAAM